MQNPTKLTPSAVEKLAARAGINRLRQLFRSGNIQEAEQLAAHAPQILAGRNLPRGSQIRNLGSGSEGVAQHVLMPEGRSAVVKTYDKTSPIYSPVIQQTRAQLAGREIPGHAQTYAFRSTPQAEYAINEFIPAAKAKPTPQQIAETQAQVRHAVPGHEMLDIGKQNMVVDARTGQAKVIDSLPVRQQDTMPANLRKGMPENVLNYHLDPNSPTGQSVNAFKEHAPEWRRDQIAAAPQAAGPMARTLPHAQDRTVAVASPTSTAKQQNQLRQQNRSVQKQYEATLLQQAYGRSAPQPAAAARPQAAPQANPQATVAARPQAMAPQSTVAARPRMMTPQDVATVALQKQ